jgi:LmbE family N-acetylglucosaminyl deacetylase
MSDLLRANARRLMIFAHPSHELGLFGLAQKVEADFLFLTDGNVRERIAESRAALATISRVAGARYLEIPEFTVYEKVIERDLDFFREIVHRVREVVDEVEPDQILCDAVEFYNPSHDMTLPITLAALAGREVDLYEVPLIHELRDGEQRYVMQRVVPSRRGEAVAIHLTPEETAAKKHARDEIYLALKADLGQTVTGVSDEALSLEEVRLADRGLAKPPDECVLRYDYRGRKLKERGEVDQALSYAEHYRPVAAALLAAAA